MPFPTNNCDPRLIVVDDSTGCTLTRAAIRTFTKQDFEDQALKEVGMDRIIAATKEARMAGVKERTLMDLLLSKHVALKESQGGGSRSIIAPFSLVPRRNTVNANYFMVEAGAVHPAAGQNGLHPGAWQVTVNTGVSQFKSALQNIERYFLQGLYVLIEYLDANTKVAYSAVFKVVDAANANAGNTQKAKVTLEPNYSFAGWANLDAGSKAVYQPTVGTVVLMANSVSDYESYKPQFPAVNNATLIEYWQQTMRWCHSFSDEYIKALEAPLTSDYFKKFRSLPIVEQRKQQEMLNEMSFFNSVFYGDQINENQTVEGYTKLPQVFDPANPSCPMEFKANTLGIRTQLGRCGQLTDRQGAPLNLDVLFESLYTMKRNREVGGGTVDVVDCITNRFSASVLHQTMIKYYKAKYSADVNLYVQPNQKVMFGEQKILQYSLYELPDQGLQLAVFTDDYFNDRYGAFQAGVQKTRGSALWLVDWSDVMINIIRTNSVKRRTNVADELYHYVMTPNVTETLLNSKSFEVRLGDTNRHAIIENFDPNACPTVTVAGCDLSNVA